MSDREAVLKAILDDPADDLPRLAFADLCEEAGDVTRAEFIRVQLEQARLPEPEYKTIGPVFGNDGTFYDNGKCVLCRPGQRCQWHALWQRADDLIAGASVPPYFNSHMPAAILSWRWTRGFVSYVRCPFDAWRQHGPALAAAHPLERVELSDKRPHASAMFSVVSWWEPRLACGDRSDIPLDVFALLCGGNLRSGEAGKWREYATVKDAEDDLSQALLASVKLPAEQVAA